jgi:putative transposase
LKARWTPHDVRDQVVDYVRHWSDKTELPAGRLVRWLGIATSKFFDWRKRYGRVNEHNAWVPRDHWLTDEEKKAILDFRIEFPLEGYRQLAFMMLDRDVVAASPSSVYRVLHDAGLLHRGGAPSKKGTGFVQPLQAHEHWHVDVSYLNIRGTFYFLCSVLDGYSRFIVHWDIGETMKEREIEVIVQRAREKFPDVTPRIISDNGPQFIAKEFKAFVRLCGMTHVRTSPYYPQSNGKIERWHKSLKTECIRPNTPLSLDDAKRSVAAYVTHYNEARLHSAIGYISPKDQLEGRAEQIFAGRDRKLAAARERRAAQRRDLANHATPTTTTTTRAEDRATLGSDPSAVPGAKTEEGRRTRPDLPFGFGTHAINPTSPLHLQTRHAENSISG